MTSTIRVGKLKKPVKLHFYYSPGVMELAVDQVFRSHACSSYDKVRCGSSLVLWLSG